jgi:predicted O-methyltransferase YrrM
MVSLGGWRSRAESWHRVKRAAEIGFRLSCDDDVGRLLAVLAAAVRFGGRILEIGTGMGVGLAWMVAGLGDRDDVEVVTIEFDPARSADAHSQGWPTCVDFVVGDAIDLLPSLGLFDLIFADAEGGKWYGLELTIDALAPGGLLVLDDLQPSPAKTAEERTAHLRKSSQ